MTNLLEHHLLNRPEDALYTLSALENGEINLDRYEKDDTLISMALHAAARKWHENSPADALLKILQILTAHGWRAWPENGQGFHPFSEALSIRSAPIVKWLAEQPGRPADLFTLPPDENGYSRGDPLFSSIRNAPMLKTLFELGARVDTLHSSGDTLLHSAETPDVVRVLLGAGADPSALDGQGNDVISVWSEKSILLKDRQEMEALISAAAPLNPDRILREFGASMQKIGVQQTKTRLSEAGIDPKTARYKDLSLVDIVVGEALEAGFKTNTYRYIDGHPLSHRKWRKLLLATLRMQGGPDRNDQSEGAQRVRESVALFLSLDRILTSPKLAAEHKRSEEKHGKQAVIDTSVHDLCQAVGFINESDMRANHIPLDRIVAWFDRLQSSGILKNKASRTALYLISPKCAGPWTHRREDMKTAKNFLELVKRGTRFTWDSDFGDNTHTLTRLPPEERPAVHVQMVQAILHMPHAVGALTLLFGELAPKLIDAAIDENIPVIPGDRWMEKAIETQRGMSAEGPQKFGEKLSTIYESKALSATTPEARAPRSVRRM